jgi:hypothetical protein
LKKRLFFVSGMIEKLCKVLGYQRHHLGVRSRDGSGDQAAAPRDQARQTAMLLCVTGHMAAVVPGLQPGVSRVEQGEQALQHPLSDLS